MPPPSLHLYTYADPPNPKHVDQILDVLRHDGVIAMSTGTNWAFAADPTSKKANQRIQRLKPNHSNDRPFSLMCSDIAMATTMTAIDGSAYRRLRRIWPGPFTVLLKASRQLPRVLKTKRAIVGVRIPDDPFALHLIERFGGPLVVSTVPKNPDGTYLTMGYEVQELFGHALDLVVDLGEPLPATETTVLDLTSGEVEVVRQGVGDISLL